MTHGGIVLFLETSKSTIINKYVYKQYLYSLNQWLLAQCMHWSSARPWMVLAMNDFAGGAISTAGARMVPMPMPMPMEGEYI